MTETAAGRPRILLVEDDTELRGLLVRLLGDEGFRVDAVGDGHTGLHYALTRDYVTLVIDRGIPAIDGLDLTQRLRRQNVGTPIMMLTAYGTIADRVAGLDAGAEDYLVKPFDVDEFLARVRALVRRHRAGAETVAIGEATLDVLHHTVLLPDGVEVELSQREAALLRNLAVRPGRVVSRSELLAQVFGAAESVGVVDTYVHYLRRKLGTGAILTVRGVGYRIGSL